MFQATEPDHLQTWVGIAIGDNHLLQIKCFTHPVFVISQILSSSGILGMAVIFLLLTIGIILGKNRSENYLLMIPTEIKR